MPFKNKPPEYPESNLFEPELTDVEKRALRSILKNEDRVQWFWGSVRVWSLWIGAVVGGLTVGSEALKRFIKFFSQ